MHEGYSQYRQTAIHTASPEQLVIMLYDGAIRFVEEARQQMEAGGAGDVLLSRVEDIIIELMVTLNHEASEVSGTLSSLYNYFLSRLATARGRRDLAALVEVRELMRELRSAFSMAAGQMRREAEKEVIGLNHRA